MSASQVRFKRVLSDEMNEVYDVLIAKNRQYGNAYLEPKAVFFVGSPADRVNARIDEKLSRRAAAQADDCEDTELDLIGLLLIKRVMRRLESKASVDEQRDDRALLDGCESRVGL